MGWGLRGRGFSTRRGVGARRYIRDVGQVRDLATGSVDDVDSVVVEQEAGGAIEFDTRLLIGGFGGYQIGLAGGEGGGILQNCRLSGESYFQLLLIGIEGLPRKVDGRLCRLDCGAVLLHVKLRIADFDAYLIFQLVLADQGLTKFEFGAHLVGLRKAVANGNVQAQADSFIRSSSIYELI